MLPPSWKSEVQKAVEETIQADAHERQAHQNDAATKIAASLKTISDTQDRQTSHQDSSSKKNLALNIVTIALVFLTVYFTYRSWRTFEAQLSEMQKVYGPIQEQATAANIGNRAWISPRYVWIEGKVKEGVPIQIGVLYDNAGKTPALNVEFRSDGKYIAKSDGVPVDPAEYFNPSIGENLTCKFDKVTYIGVAYPASNQAGYMTSIPITEPAISGEIIARTKILVIQGCYTYKTLETWHHSKFCQFLLPVDGSPPEAWHFKHCADGNDAD